MEAYLDNAATTPCYPEAAAIVQKTMLEEFGNPSSMHQKGVDAEKYVKEAQETIAGLLRVQPKEIFFTSGGTESNNWALIGTALQKRRSGRHLITTAIEHSAVAAPMAFLEKEGYEVTRLHVDHEGYVDLRELEDAIREDTVLVSVMHVNNELGTVEPIAKIGELVKKKNPNTLFHVDAIQSFGKFMIYPKRMNVDMLSVSSHKIHGPKGAGFLFVDEKIKISPIIWGGGQQNGMRSGTDNVPGIAGMGVAAKKMYATLENNTEQMYRCKELLAEGLSSLGDVVIHGPENLRNGAPHVLNASILGIRSEVLLHTLEEKGIYVSSGSACSSHRRAGSATMNAIGCRHEEIESSVRFSFSEWTTEEEIAYTLQVLREVVPMLRRFVRR